MASFPYATAIDSYGCHCSSCENRISVPLDVFLTEGTQQDAYRLFSGEIVNQSGHDDEEVFLMVSTHVQ